MRPNEHLLLGVNKLRKKAKLVIGDRVDVFFSDEDEDAAISTAAALEANTVTLQKAKISPLPLAARCRYASDIATDLAPTPFGSKCLRVTLCRPTPVLSDKALKSAREKAGDTYAEALSHLLSTLPVEEEDTIEGSLDGTPFSLKVGRDFFPDATAKAAALAGGGGIQKP